MHSLTVVILSYKYDFGDVKLNPNQIHSLEFVFIADQVPWIRCDTAEGRKLYFCTFCNVKCARLYTIKQHSLIHTGEKPYQCQACGKRFRRKQHLKEHMIRHMKPASLRCGP